MLRVGLLPELVSLLATPIGAQSRQSPQWIDVEGPQGAKLRAVVFRPTGDGPFPVVVVLHDSPGGLSSIPSRRQASRGQRARHRQTGSVQEPAACLLR